MSRTHYGLFRHISRGFQASIWVPLLYSVIASLGLILAFWRHGDMSLDSKERNSFSNHGDSFDFIIVGAGTAGCLVANRLSKHFKVLLLEAGGEPHPLQNIPGFSAFLLRYPEVDWSHLSVPQKRSTLNSVNQQSSWSAGIGLGGSSSLNLMLYLRGVAKDYDNWARITGDWSWGYESLLPLFKKHESYGDPNGDPHYHGFDGELHVELPGFTGIADEFVRAGIELGYPEIDINANPVPGFFKLFHTTESGVRDSSYRAFIKRNRKRSTLVVKKYALVSKILFREGNREVYGVEFIRHGRTERAYASKEVIISAGAITTPKLLLLSGIGPWEDLQRMGIPVKHNLPVGENLQDHTAAYFGPVLIDPPRTTLLDRDITPGAFVQWFTTGDGHLSSSGAHASAVLASEFAKARGEGDWPDFQLFLFGYSVHSNFYKTFAKSFGIKEDELRRYYADAVGQNGAVVVISGARPYSRGTIKLGGTSPHDALVIDPNYLSDRDDVDLKVLLEAVRATIHIFENTTTMQNLGARVYNKPLPGCENLLFRSEAYWICFIRRYTVTLHHPCGTAAMGPIGSPNAVVDPELRVQGVNNLRIVDASIMPVVVVTNTQASSYIIGEKGAHMILQKWGKNTLDYYS